MALAIDSQGKDGTGGTGTSKTFAFTNTAGNLLIVDTWSNGGNPGAITMTYGGVTMTQIGSTQTSGGTYHAVFYLASPPTGSNNLVTTYTNSSTSGFFSHLVSYSGATTSSPIGTPVQQITGNIGNDSITVNVATANSWIVWFQAGVAGRTYTAGAGTTLRSSASDAQAWVFDSNAALSTGNNTLNSTISSGTEVKIDTAFEIKVASAAAATTPRLRSLLGVGL